MRKPELFVDGKLNTRMIVNYIKERHKFVTFTSDTGKKPRIHIYKDGFYSIRGDLILEQHIKKIFTEDYWTVHNKNEIMEYIKGENMVDRDEVQPPKHLINVNNGIYNLNTDKLMPHDPKHLFLYKIPINYNPKAKMPKIDKYFESTLKQEYIKFSQEIFGYCLFLSYPIHGIVYLFGKGGNGKGVWIHLLASMLGKENISNKEIGNLMVNHFASSSLYGKLANLCGEMSNTVMHNTDMLKRLSAGDRIDAEFKFRDPFSFPNKAKIITACNEIPECKDTSDGWIQRQFIVPFMETFRRTPRDNTKLKEQLVADKDEMEGLLLWSIQGLKRLLRNEQFSYKDQEKRYMIFQDSIQYFLDEYYIGATLNDYIECTKLQEAYRKMCDKKSIPPSSETLFGLKMKRNGYPRDRIKKNNRWIWVYHCIKKM